MPKYTYTRKDGTTVSVKPAPQNPHVKKQNILFIKEICPPGFEKEALALFLKTFKAEIKKKLRP